ncbi:hypothetical protein DRH14_00655 [Candidatus Shapirobacteria bacterium]|nr:MAG: hypothetical protein DRH14_00655 [Candidatus Shapirobacteria bacterium]
MEFELEEKFKKEFKKLFKRYRSLDKDFVFFQQLIVKLLDTITVRSANHHAILYRDQENNLFIFKSRLQCRTLRRNSLRLIYVYKKDEQKIRFIQIYFKGDRQNEDVARWKKFKKF